MKGNPNKAQIEREKKKGWHPATQPYNIIFLKKYKYILPVCHVLLFWILEAAVLKNNGHMLSMQNKFCLLSIQP